MQELKNKDAAVVVFSGGQDSTTCLFWALKRYKRSEGRRVGKECRTLQKSNRFIIRLSSETCKRIRVCKENLP